jgi:hypothetical protein
VARGLQVDGAEKVEERMAALATHAVTLTTSLSSDAFATVIGLPVSLV